jgi:hypothetical protein
MQLFFRFITACVVSFSFLFWPRSDSSKLFAVMASLDSSRLTPA